MTYIASERDLRTAYGILRILCDGSSCQYPEKIKKYADQTKKAIRKYRDSCCGEGRVIKADFDEVLEVFPLPENLKTSEDADAYFVARHYREAVPSMYDCTGQVFTSWYKIFKRRGRFWAYHKTLVDC